MLNEKKTVKFQSHAHVRTPRSAPEHVGYFFVTSASLSCHCVYDTGVTN